MVEDVCTETDINESIFFFDLIDNICISLFGKNTNPKPRNSSNKMILYSITYALKRENIFFLN